MNAETVIWKVDQKAVEKVRRPFHGDLLPTGVRVDHGNETSKSDQKRRSARGDDDAAPGALSGTGKVEAQTNDSTIAGPTDIQVEEMLRAKYSTAKLNA